MAEPRTLLALTDTVGNANTDALVNLGRELHTFTVVVPAAFGGVLEFQGRSRSDTMWRPVRYWRQLSGSLVIEGPFIGGFLPLPGATIYYVADPWAMLRVAKVHGSGALAVDYLPQDREADFLPNFAAPPAPGPLEVQIVDGPAVVSVWDEQGPIGLEHPLPVAATIADGANVVEGATTGAKVITDANGTIQQYLRGLIYLFITSGQALVTAIVSSVTPGTGATNLGKAEDAVHTSGDVGVMAIGVRQDTPTALAAAGDYTPYETDANGNVHVNLGTLLSGEDQTNGLIGVEYKPVSSATYSPTISDYNAAAVTKLSVKASAGNVFHVRAVNRNAAARWFQLHNKASAPAATEVPLIEFWMPANSVLDYLFTHGGARFGTGIAWAWSTTADAFTDAATASEHEVLMEYV